MVLEQKREKLGVGNCRVNVIFVQIQLSMLIHSSREKENDGGKRQTVKLGCNELWPGSVYLNNIAYT